MADYLDSIWDFDFLYAFILLVAYLGSEKLGKHIHCLYTPKQVKIARFGVILVNILVLVVAIEVLFEIWTQWGNFGWRFYINLFILACIVPVVIFRVKENVLLLKPVNKVIANSHAILSSCELESDLDVQAKINIQKACELNPEEPRYWLILSAQEQNIQKAKEYLQVAEDLIKKKNIKCNKIHALMEFNKGCLFLNENGKMELALQHFNHSLALKYNKERAKFIEKVKASKKG
jgi:hypothetical protein